MSKLGHSSMPLITFAVQGVDKLLTGRNPKKAQDPNKISPRLLKELHTEIQDSVVDPSVFLAYINGLPKVSGVVCVCLQTTQ